VVPRERLFAARAAYVAVILLATLTDLELSGDFAGAGWRLMRAFDPSVGWKDAVDGLRNVVLFAGLGAVWAATSAAGRPRAEILRATLVGCTLSALAEGLQVFSPVRVASILDLVTNTFGAFAGAYALVLLLEAVGRARDAPSFLGVPAFLAAGAYALGVLSEAATPLFRDVQLQWIEGGPPMWMREVLTAVPPPAWAQVPLTDALLFAPAGFLVVLALSERGRGTARVWPWVAGVGAVSMVATELAHGLLRLPILWAAAAAHAVAVALGAWVAHRWLAPLGRALQGPARARVSLLVYGIFLAVWGWRPFRPETSLRAIADQFTAEHLVPLRALAAREDIFSAMDVAQQFALYLPLGCVLAVWPLRRTGPWSQLWPAVYLAAAIELGHVVIADRFFDVTNALVAWAGLAIGWVLVRRAGFQPQGAASGG
jgi:VanZ family protein